MTKYSTICLIVAAGTGERLGNTIAKQYIKIAGKAILLHTIDKFKKHPEIDAIMVVYNPNHQELYNQTIGNLAILPPVFGGKTRQESVRLGLEAIEKYSPSKVLIHDAARPMVDSKIISDVIASLNSAKAAIPAIEAQDTIKKYKNGKIVNTIERDNLMLAQTPQGFIFKDILSAHKNTKQQVFTDDASLFEHLGLDVQVIAGSQNNFKITTNNDLKRAESLMLMNFETRIGMGFDAHKFCAPKLPENNHIMLCGVAVPHTHSLEGHSDADVGIHAAVDAILGAISRGDIGTHFPPSEEKWKGADSSIFLDHARQLLNDIGASIVNIDITLICEKPKILPHKDKMCETIAKILDIEKSRVSVKATTTEGMGFTGRKEGIAAQAVVSIKVQGN